MISFFQFSHEVPMMCIRLEEIKLDSGNTDVAALYSHVTCTASTVERPV